MRLPCPGNLGEEVLQSGPTPVIGKEEESGEALPLFQRNHPAQVFLREISVHLRITAIPQPYSCQDKVVPLATRDPYKQVSQGKEMPGSYSILSLGIARPAFPGTGGRKIKMMVSYP